MNFGSERGKGPREKIPRPSAQEQERIRGAGEQDQDGGEKEFVPVSSSCPP